MSELLDILLLIKPWVGGILCVIGALLALIGSIGVLRFPDFFTRLHAASITDTSAVTLGLLGMAILAPNWLVVFKLAAIWLFIFLTSPTGSHALANAAHTAGLQPVLGRDLKRPDNREEEA
ncbi:monovalent cation/H(+) antiporter subunit G [Henriciella algicola]|jgi:multicomponent Na+:H+ antiporter subunit G|uniref:Sodium:proton antiporter n=1 Tax=Henriciella algicola TaxID=1608422 RepID=A0A399RD85_9PROT|nr:monovalent cation/H(+) antiporter subunit G [Henriciella algicola]RIJ29536.1 sodium:proton antiporter [Henriciella algicola]